LLSNSFTITLSLRSSLNIRDHVSHPNTSISVLSKMLGSSWKSWTKSLEQIRYQNLAMNWNRCGNKVS
jgi:hypothetical protein